jgi:hypothetical protein
MNEAVALTLSPETVLGEMKKNGVTHVVWLPDSETLRGHPPPGNQAQSRANSVVEARRAGGVEAELDRRGDFIDVLPTGATGAQENLLDLALVDRNALGDRDHWFDRRQPLMQMRGSSVAALRDRPARCAASTTAAMSL